MDEQVKKLERFQKKLKKVRMLLMDVDGVLTDGSIILGTGNMELKCFNVQDGMGITLARYGDIKVGIITGRSSEAVTRRAEELHFDVLYQNARDKMDAYEEILTRYDLPDRQVCFIGDDIQDIAVMEKAGVSVAVANARQEVRDIADYTTNYSGGKGAVREVVEELLIAQGKWEKVLNQMGLTTR
jgi:3-deoxy-D-manno-octulosonate 8-phosphate phosphatase (KDO 8-P phosphatase)